MCACSTVDIWLFCGCLLFAAKGNNALAAVGFRLLFGPGVNRVRYSFRSCVVSCLQPSEPLAVLIWCVCARVCRFISMFVPIDDVNYAPRIARGRVRGLLSSSPQQASSVRLWQGRAGKAAGIVEGNVVCCRVCPPWRRRVRECADD